MTYDEALMKTFIAILAVGYLVSFLCCYFFGWYSDKRLRNITRRIRIYPFEKIFLHFRGGYQNKTNKFSALCVCFERMGMLMLVMIPVSLLLTKLFKNILIFCRISLAAAAASLSSVIIAAISSQLVIKKQVRKSGKKKKKSSFKELDDISSGFEKITAKKPDSENDAIGGSIMESDKADEIKSFKENFNQPKQSRSFYRPVVKDSKLESFTDVRQRQAESAEENDLSATQSSEEIRNAINDFKQKNPIADENIVITNYSQVSAKYRNVKIKEKFADEDSLEQGQEILRKRKRELSGEENVLIDTDGSSDLEILKDMKNRPVVSDEIGGSASGKPSDLEMLKTIKEKQHDDSEVGSLKDMIEQHTKG